ncbi:AMP-dependent synthetase and ligase, partial [mine drainage metagenome]
MSAPSSTDPARPWLDQYPPKVPAHVPIPPGTLQAVIGEAMRNLPDHTALIYYGRRWTYRQLDRESARFAASLRREGVRPGDRVALYLPNCPAYPIAFLGALRAGAIVVQVSALYFGEDLTALLKDSQPKAVVTLEILYPNLERIRGAFFAPVVYVARLREFYPARTRPFVNMVLRRQGRDTRVPHGPEIRRWGKVVRTPGTIDDHVCDPATTVAVFQYTGGTTGIAKAAMLTHRNLLANITQLNTWNTLRDSGQETILASIPFFHIYGLTVALLIALVDGDAVIIQTRPDIPEALKLVDRYHPTQLPGVPALYMGLIRFPDIGKFHLRSIKFCLSGSAPLPVEVMRRFEELTGARLIEGYGLSEASPATHANPVEGARRAGSIGLPLPDTDQRIVDLETGKNDMAPGEVGELCVRGPQVMAGYFHNAADTSAALVDGWLHTGDVARIDADGWAYIVDRKKDMINVGGFKVYPREVEEILFQHAAVADAAVVGVPDAEHGEAVRAYVVLKPGASATAAELIDFVRERIAHYKAPRSIQFRSELPRSGVQKVLRRVLHAEAIAE